jgi:PAS domain S-box-containing protein
MVIGALPIILFLLGAAVLAVVNAFRATSRRIANARPFSLLMLATAWWSFGYAMELNSIDPEIMLLWAKVEYLGIVAIPPLWLLFAARYADDDLPVARHFWLSLSVIPLITFLLVTTNELHHLIWASVEVRTVDALRLLAVTRGLWFWVHTVFSYTLIVVGSMLLLRTVWNTAAIYRSQIVLLSASALVPLIGNVIFVTGLIPLSYLDPTPLLFALSGLLIIWGDNRSRLHAVVPIARGLVIEKMSDGVVVLNAQQQVADLNQAAEQIFHCAAARAIGSPFTALYADWPEIALPLIDGPDTAIEMTRGEMPARSTFDMRVSALANRRGQDKGYLIVLRDITERKQAEIGLQAQKALFENLVAVARAGAAHPTLRATLSNLLQAAMLITESSHGSMVLLSEDGTPLQSILANGQVETEQEQAVVRQVLHAGLAGWAARERRVALAADTQNDPRWLALADRPFPTRSALAVPIPDQQRVLGIITLSHTELDHFDSDHVTLMQAAADQIRLALRNVQMWEIQRELADRAETASRAKSAFIANISHELRTPLNAILGYSQILAEEVGELGKPALVANLDQITVAGKQLLGLINDVIDLSRIEAGQMESHTEPVDIAALMMHVIDETRELAAKNHNTLSLICPAEIGIVRVDVVKVRQVLLNLLSNACKFTQRGHITCTVGLEPPDGEPAALLIAVSDTGIGMSSGQIDQLFAQFVQADSSMTRRYGGMGLGLALCQNLCRLMGGEVSVVSALGQGSTFTVRLPVQVRAEDGR